MTREDLDFYLFHRLAGVGCTAGSLFMKKAKDILYQASNGVPRIVNILCHKALLAAYGKGELRVTRRIMRSAISDSKIKMPSSKILIRILIIGLGMVLSTGLVIHYLLRII